MYTHNDGSMFQEEIISRMCQVRTFFSKRIDVFPMTLFVIVQILVYSLTFIQVEYQFWGIIISMPMKLSPGGQVSY